MPVADALQFLQEKCRCGNEPAFTLNWLDDDGRDFLGCEEPLEHLLFEEFQDFRAASFRRVAVRAAVCVGKWNMLHAAKERPKILALRILGSRQRERAKRAAVKASVEGDQLVPLRRITRQLDRAFDRFRSGVAEEHFLVFFARHSRHQPLRQLRQVMVIKIRAGNMNEFGRLPLNRFDHCGVAVPRRADRDTCRKIQEGVSINILNDCAAALLGHQRIFAG